MRLLLETTLREHWALSIALHEQTADTLLEP